MVLTQQVISVETKIHKPLTGKVAVVTGGAGGIGMATVAVLAQAGAEVAIIELPGKEQEASSVAMSLAEMSGLELAVYADVTKPQQIREAMACIKDRTGRIDIFIANAGITRDRSFAKQTDEEWDQVIQTNLNGVRHSFHAVWPFMIEQKYGRLVAISSVIGLAGNFGQTNYAAAKAGINALVTSLAREGAKHNINVNSVAPGYTATPMVLERMPQDVRDQKCQETLLRRFAEPEEIADGILFLVKPGAGDYMTGTVLVIDGGYLL